MVLVNHNLCHRQSSSCPFSPKYHITWFSFRCIYSCKLKEEKVHTYTHTCVHSKANQWLSEMCVIENRLQWQIQSIIHANASYIIFIDWYWYRCWYLGVYVCALPQPFTVNHNSHINCCTIIMFAVST